MGKYGEWVKTMTIDTITADAFLIRAFKVEEGSKNYVQTIVLDGACENAARERANKAFPEGKYLTECRPVKKLSPGVYCAVDK